MTIRLHRLGLIALIWFALSSAAYGQSHSGHVAGMSHGADSSILPAETGQSAFAALAEIIALLEADPHTDWTEVNIDALRTHLVDMDQLTLLSTVRTQMLDEQRIKFRISGEGRTVKTIQTMVPTHAGMVRTSTGWDIEVNHEPDGVTLIVNPESPEGLTKLRALGFFGFMTIGAHHQLHHLQMATGQGH